MHKFPHELLNRMRTPSRALADLLAKYDAMPIHHTERCELALMIERLRIEIAIRRGGAFGPASAAMGLYGARVLPLE